METLKTILEQQLKAVENDLIEITAQITDLEGDIILAKNKKNEANKMARDIQKKLEKIK